MDLYFSSVVASEVPLVVSKYNLKMKIPDHTNIGSCLILIRSENCKNENQDIVNLSVARWFEIGFFCFVLNYAKIFLKVIGLSAFVQ